MSRVVMLAPAPLCEREVLRYAGCRTADEAVQQLLGECLREALPVLSYMACYEAIDPTPYTAQSVSLKCFLDGCERVYAMAATVGVALDRLILKYGRLSPSKAVLLQAIGAERVEALCEAVCEHIAAEDGLFVKGRFSAGYGDVPLTLQTDLVKRLDTVKHIGVTVNDSLLLSPTKSVTAFVGLSATPQTRHDPCRNCDKRDCTFRGAV